MIRGSLTEPRRKPHHDDVIWGFFLIVKLTAWVPYLVSAAIAFLHNNRGLHHAFFKSIIKMKSLTGKGEPEITTLCIYKGVYEKLPDVKAVMLQH
ncbi:hypothetical protein CEXT_768801 [Caerostris extrusa]|uniref:Uncharacterized protein n=1 Tax=Caerostris extrusa TaxID=172846 RepID=A0AAV4XL81_CAEEX|nr:hypothetical protein CEXT_768801 [Caerostris extrusa]